MFLSGSRRIIIPNKCIGQANRLVSRMFYVWMCYVFHLHVGNWKDILKDRQTWCAGPRLYNLNWMWPQETYCEYFCINVPTSNDSLWLTSVHGCRTTNWLLKCFTSTYVTVHLEERLFLVSNASNLLRPKVGHRFGCLVGAHCGWLDEWCTGTANLPKVFMPSRGALAISHKN